MGQGVPDGSTFYSDATSATSVVYKMNSDGNRTALNSLVVNDA